MELVPQTLPGVLGSPGRRVALPGATMQVVDYAAALNLPRHEHAQATLCYVYAGAVEEQSDGRRHEFATDTLVLRPPRHAHATRFGSQGAHSLVVEIAPERLAQWGPLRELERPCQVQSEAASWLARQLQGEMTRHDSASAMATEGLLLALLAEAERPRSPSHRAPSLRECEEFLQAQFLRPIGLNEVAAAAGLHPSHVARSFRAVHGCTVGEYVRRLRLRWAAEQIAATEMSLSDIAVSAGFYDQSHFTNCFRRLLGQTPAAYRAAARG